MISMKNFSVTRGSKTICRVESLTVHPGEKVVIVGANGSGKTTMLRTLANLNDLFEGSCDTSCGLYGKVYVHQNPFLFRGTVLQNVRYGLRARNFPTAQSNELAMDWIERVGIGELANRAARSLSGGEQKRTVLARALALNPELLLLDEPFADLDQAGEELLAGLVCASKNMTVLIATPNQLPSLETTQTYHLG